MSEITWENGTVVRLKSGGVAMTVVGRTAHKKVVCQWVTTDGLPQETWTAPEGLEVACNASARQSQPALDVQATADACRSALQTALGIRDLTSWSDLIYVVRSRTEEHRTDRVEADQTLITAQTEIARLAGELKREELAHAGTRKVLAESNADHNKLVVKVSELERNLAAERSETSRLRVNFDNDVRRIERELASERTLLSEVTARLAAIEEEPFKYLNGRGFRLGNVMVESTADLQDVGAGIAQHINETVEAKDIAQARELLNAKPGEMAKEVAALQERLDNAKHRLTVASRADDDARRLLGTTSIGTLADAVTGARSALGCAAHESVLLAAERVARDLKSSIAERDRYSSLLVKVRLAVNQPAPMADLFLIQTIELHYQQSTIAKRAASLLGSTDVSQLCRSVEELRDQRSEAARTMLTLRLILEAKDDESLNQAATRVRLELSDQSNRRTEAEGRLAAIKRALGNDGLLA